jgi:hypothetical protein
LDSVNSNNASEWNKFELKKFNSSVVKLAWDDNGTHLAVTTSDGVVYIFKEEVEGTWALTSMSNAEGVMENVASDK